ncbi:MAG: dUTP diphosphatase [Tepidisphaeraceae bacterium]
MLTLKIKKLPHGQDLPLPAKQTEHAAGLDLVAAVEADVTLKPMQITLVPCGFAMEIPAGYEAQVRPRSGLSSKFGVTLINCVGTIDADYRGEVKVPLINLGTADYVVKRGERIAQMIVTPVPSVSVVEVDELSDTSRGEGGFGHTGKH